MIECSYVSMIWYESQDISNGIAFDSSTETNGLYIISYNWDVIYDMLLTMNYEIGSNNLVEVNSVTFEDPATFQTLQNLFSSADL